MSALRLPLLEIPIDDSKAQKFFASSHNYQEGLGKTSAQWKRTTEAVFGQREAFRQLGNAGRPVESLWKNINGWSGSVLSNTLGITKQLLKWTTILGGGLIGGSLFGIDRMARDVANYRRTSMGLGMSVGGMRSFGINMSRFTDTGSFLSAINAAVSNPALQGPLYSMGVSPLGSTEQVSLSMLKAMRRLALSTPRGELGLASQNYGLGAYGGLETLMRLRNTPAGEFYKQLTAEQRDRTGLGLPPGVARKWQDFSTQMERAGATIFKTFVVGLAPLEKPLEGLSVAFTGFLQRLMSGPLLKHGIDKLADFLNHFSVEMESKRFQNAVSSLVSDTGIIAREFRVLADDIRAAHPAWAVTKAVVKSPATLGHGFAQLLGDMFITKSGYRSYLSGLDKSYNLPAGTLERTWHVEAGDRLNPGTSSAGAMGPMQLMPGTAARYGVDPEAPYMSAWGAARYLSDLQKRFHGNMAAAEAGYNWGPQHVAALMRQYGTGWRGHLPRSVNAYVEATTPDPSLRIGVIVRHATGGSAVRALAGLAAQP